jgi:molybdopterin synthase catalytic subunit/molybdopterin converting factor small subunit
MQIVVRLFALQRQLIGRRELPLELPDEATIADAWLALVAAYPPLESAGPSVRFARNGVYAEVTDRLGPADELAVIPPVAGGSGSGDARVRRIELTPAPIADDFLAELRRSVASDEDGAVVVFLGQTRSDPGTPAPGQEDQAARFAGQLVEGLEYEAFDTMALRVLDQIAEEIESRFGVRRLAIVHRTGSVPLGDASVVIAAAAPHRGAAFDACRYAIEEVKARAPIWKSERFRDGSVWIGSPPRTGPTDEAG